MSLFISTSCVSIPELLLLVTISKNPGGIKFATPMNMEDYKHFMHDHNESLGPLDAYMSPINNANYKIWGKKKLAPCQIIDPSPKTQL